MSGVPRGPPEAAETRRLRVCSGRRGSGGRPRAGRSREPAVPPRRPGRRPLHRRPFELRRRCCCCGVFFESHQRRRRRRRRHGCQGEEGRRLVFNSDARSDGGAAAGAAAVPGRDRVAVAAAVQPAAEPAGEESAAGAAAAEPQKILAGLRGAGVGAARAGLPDARRGADVPAAGREAPGGEPGGASLRPTTRKNTDLMKRWATSRRSCGAS
mmetsp:Transcript_5066/g.15923  ORF Transcript_5066/g.15923 Transcript_5066/m.15923 type:complete len:212 (-) Transcript_5066:1640-2275(-)